MSPLVLLGWLSGWAAAGKRRPLPAMILPTPVATSPAAPRVSVVVPARNEAARLPGLLAALEKDKSLGADWELIVVDDGSTDGSADIARHAGARVMTTRPPLGWNGKPWACWVGAQAACGQTIVFLDADTRPAPGFVAALAANAQHLDGLVSVQPRHYVVRPYENLSAICNVVALMAGTATVYPGRAGWWRGPVGFGPAMALPAARYQSLGGHASVRRAIAEDLAIASVAFGHGLPVGAHTPGAGKCLIAYRMYPGGPRELLEGWTKNLAAGAGAIPVVRRALIATWVAGSALAALGAGRSLRPYVMFAFQMAVLMRRAGRFHPAAPLLYPAPLLAFGVFFARSAFRRLTRQGATWRGRRVNA